MTNDRAAKSLADVASRPLPSWMDEVDEKGERRPPAGLVFRGPIPGWSSD